MAINKLKREYAANSMVGICIAPNFAIYGLSDTSSLIAIPVADFTIIEGVPAPI